MKLSRRMTLFLAVPCLVAGIGTVSLTVHSRAEARQAQSRQRDLIKNAATVDRLAAPTGATLCSHDADTGFICWVADTSPTVMATALTKSLTALGARNATPKCVRPALTRFGPAVCQVTADFDGPSRSQFHALVMPNDLESLPAHKEESGHGARAQGGLTLDLAIAPMLPRGTPISVPDA